MAEIAVLIAHKRTRANDRALKIALETLIDNTDVDYELLVDTTTPADPYVVYNRLAGQATAPWIVFLNSDTFAGPNWARPMLAAAAPDTIVAPVLVECGKIGVHVLNYARDFGDKPENFKRGDFESFVRAGGEWREGEGWYMPSLHPRARFLELGGFPTERGVFPKDALDELYWAAWKAQGGKVVRVRAWFYHLQNWSNEAEQTKRG